MTPKVHLVAFAASAVLASAATASAAPTLLVAAGGGGGAGYTFGSAGDSGQAGTSGSNGLGTFGGAGGSGGAGGLGGTYSYGYNGGGGAGWLGAGTAGVGTYPAYGVEEAAGQGASSGPSFAGGLGGNTTPDEGAGNSSGGYGGGGGGGWQGGGGGGGYSGGGGGDGETAGGGGGGSYGALLGVTITPGFNGVDDSDEGSGVGNNGYVQIGTTDFDYTGSVQTYVVPSSSFYAIYAEGAQGGGAVDGSIGGYGALVEGLDYLTAGTQLEIVVGGAGGYGDFDGLWGGGGGGGSFIYTGTFVPEPGAWALMIVGLGLSGAALRRRRDVAAPAA